MVLDSIIRGYSNTREVKKQIYMMSRPLTMCESNANNQAQYLANLLCSFPGIALTSCLGSQRHADLSGPVTQYESNTRD